MATHPGSGVSTTRGVSFLPSNGVASQRLVEGQIVRLRQREDDEERAQLRPVPKKNRRR